MNTILGAVALATIMGVIVLFSLPHIGVAIYRLYNWGVDKIKGGNK